MAYNSAVGCKREFFFIFNLHLAAITLNYSALILLLHLWSTEVVERSSCCCSMMVRWCHSHSAYACHESFQIKFGTCSRRRRRPEVPRLARHTSDGGYRWFDWCCRTKSKSSRDPAGTGWGTSTEVSVSGIADTKPETSTRTSWSTRDLRVDKSLMNELGIRIRTYRLESYANCRAIYNYQCLC